MTLCSLIKTMIQYSKIDKGFPSIISYLIWKYFVRDDAAGDTQSVMLKDFPNMMDNIY